MANKISMLQKEWKSGAQDAHLLRKKKKLFLKKGTEKFEFHRPEKL